MPRYAYRRAGHDLRPQRDEVASQAGGPRDPRKQSAEGVPLKYAIDKPLSCMIKGIYM